ncbi:cation/multidrug efflux pump [Rivularia sp. PCC 7116]|uniref:efflux RND transporter permease subunit n=1 Tax=Rivularia sp. PCC 7116 TaxID=373994 RepID=UPI00029F3D10|nr:efflux RND transporter permease subunit [Rivularia sp. PCC 7116]AFY56898.1 cation/multidrug efflux pump [Rivularia sp. PCC 7116]
MSLIKTAVRWRHGTFVLFCILALFGVLSLLSLPLELRPGGDRPEITISTSYSGASPREVEELITRPIEERLEEVQGIQEVTSSSASGISTINLEFNWDSDIDRRLVDVLNKLQQVEALPPEAGESDVEIVSGSSSPMMWTILVAKEGFTPNDEHYRDLVDDVIVPRFRQVQGVGQFLVSGGREREVEVVVDPKALADRNLTIGDVVNALRSNNRDIRGGPLVLGRREYRVRTVSRSTDVKQLEDFVLRRDESGTVYLRDVAKAQMGRKIQDRALIRDNKPAVAVGIVRQPNANVPEISQGIRQALVDLEKRFDREGEGITFDIPYDENDYINQSISFVQGNLMMGAVLAALILLLFLGSLRTVAVIAITIPTTLITVFIVFAALGRSLNVISLASLAFAVGMVVDNAIVVLENVFTHMQMGKSPVKAAIEGTEEVGGAMLASTLTTIAVFAPIVLVQGEAGQLFFDIGIGLSASVLFSLFAALTLVPMLSGLFLNQAEAQRILQGMGNNGAGSREQGTGGERRNNQQIDSLLIASDQIIPNPTNTSPRSKGHPSPYQGEGKGVRFFRNGFLAIQNLITKVSQIFLFFQRRFENFLLATVSWSIGVGRKGRRLIVLAIPVTLLFISFQLLPPADYLPEGNRNLILWLAQPFPGTSIPEAIKLSQGPRDFVSEQPEIMRSLYVHRNGLRAIAAFVEPEQATGNKLDEIVDRFRKQGGNFPGYRFLVPRRVSIFRDPGKEFEVNIVGQDLEQLNQLQQQVMQQLRGLEGVQNARSNFVTGAPELQVIPNRVRLAEVGLSEAELGAVVEAALGGLRASEFTDGKRELDVTVELQNTSVETPEQLRQLPLNIGNGRQVQLSDVAQVVEATGPDAINHVDLERSITLTVNVSREAPLGELIEQTEQQILEPLRETLPTGFRAELAGSADVLSETLMQLGSTFVLSLLITYLLLVALYRSFSFPVLIMATVPMGISGALLSLILANTIPGVVVPLDMITGLGFVILTGVVVNNAILLVDRSLQLQQEGKSYNDSLYLAVKDRLRPIFMSAGTSVLGMLPLAVIPGKGAELYQGLGIVLTGGLAFSTILTPTVVPALMGLLRDFSGNKEIGTKQLQGVDEVEVTNV